MLSRSHSDSSGEQVPLVERGSRVDPKLNQGEQKQSFSVSLEQQLKAILEDLEVESIAELQEEIDEKQAGLEKLAGKPKRLANAENELENLRIGLQRLQTLRSEIAKQSKSALSLGRRASARGSSIVGRPSLRDFSRLGDEAEGLLSEIESKKDKTSRIQDKRNERLAKGRSGSSASEPLQREIERLTELQQTIREKSIREKSRLTPRKKSSTALEIAKELQRKQQKLFEDSEVESLQELQADIKAKKALALGLVNNPKKPKRAKKAQEELLKSEDILKEWQDIQRKIDTQNSEAAASPGSVESKIVQSVATAWSDTESGEHSGPQILAQPLARVPLDPQVKAAAQTPDEPTVPGRVFLESEKVQTLQLIHPKITEKSNQLVRFALKALAETLPLPPSAERTHFCLLQWLTLKICNIEEVQFAGSNSVTINDAWLQSECGKLSKLLEREGESKRPVLHALQKLTKNIEGNQWQEVRKQLDRLFRHHVRKLDIAQLMAMCQRVPAEGVLDGKELIVLLGKSGAGKSTTIHHLLGNEFEKTETGRLNPKKRSESLDEVRVGEGKVSETRQMRLIPLKRDGVEPELFLCDTPGFGDTGKAEGVGILNSLVISRALQQCRSLRVLVLCAVSQYGAQAQGLIETLDNLTRMFPEIDACKPAFFTHLPAVQRKLKQSVSWKM